MVLVDPRMLESLRSSSSSSGLVQPAVNQSLKELDGLMKEVLETEELDVGNKAKAYYQILRRYLHRVDQYKSQPIGTLKLDEQPESNGQVAAAAAAAVLDEKKSEEDYSDIIKTLPQKFREKGRWFLKKISSSPDFSWNGVGQLVVRGKTIKGSNINDLLNDVIRPRLKRTSPQVGWQEFAREIKRKNIPREFIGNNQRWEDLSKISSPSSSDEERQTDLYATPASHPKRRRQRKADVSGSPWVTNFDN